MSAKRTTVLIPIRSVDQLDPASLDSLRNQSRTDFDVVVLGIGCPQEAPPILLERLPGSQWLAMPAGTRTSEALNRGLHMCDTPLVSIIEPGLELDPAWLEAMQDPFALDLNVFVTSGKIYSSREPLIIESIGEAIDELGDRIPISAGDEDDGSFEFPREIFGPCASAVLFRRKLFSLVGPFDGAYGAGGEMADLAFRARWQGMKTRYVPDAHAFRATSVARPAPSPRALESDRLRLFFKCMPEPLLWLNGPRVLLAPAASWNPIAAIRGLAFVLAFLRALPGLMSRRREVLSQARVDYRYLYLRLEAREPQGYPSRAYAWVIRGLIGPHGPSSLRPRFALAPPPPPPPPAPPDDDEDD